MITVINQAIVEELLISPLCIETKYLQAIAAAAFLAYKQGSSFTAGEYKAAYAVNPKNGIQSADNFTSGSVGVVTINGPIVSASDPRAGLKGTIEAGQELQLLDQDPNLVGSVLYLESGGGSVYAIKPICDIMNGLTKPVVLFSKTVLASAAWRIGAQCDHIMMYHPQGIVGSLGTMYSSTDLQPMFEKWGIVFNEYYAPDSSLKNKTYTDAKKGDGTTLINEVLAPLNDLFLSDINNLRGHKMDAKSKTLFKGETYFADPQGIALGLVDSIGSLSDAIAMVVSLHNGDTESALTPNYQNTMLGFKRFNSLVILKGVEAKAITEAQIEAVHEELHKEGITGVTVVPDHELEALTNNQTDPAAATALATANSTITDLRAQLSAAQTAKTTAETNLAVANSAKTKLQSDLDSANARIKELGGEPAAEATTGKKEGDEAVAGEKKSATYCAADAELEKRRAEMGFVRGTGVKEEQINGVNAGFYPALPKKK